MNEEYIEKDILKNSFYMISLFTKSKKSYDGDVKEQNKLEKDENDNITEDSIEKYMKSNLCIITNLKLQKIMYFVEAYYMSKETTANELYDSEWSAWDYGPVNRKLYDYFKKYGSLELNLSEEEQQIAEQLPNINKKYINIIYKRFGCFNAFDLVSLTHMKNSPWEKIKKSKQYNFQVLNESVIDKKTTCEWFEKEFGFLDKTEEDNQ